MANNDAVELSVAKCSCCCAVWPRGGTLVLMVLFHVFAFYCRCGCTAAVKWRRYLSKTLQLRDFVTLILTYRL